MIKNNNEYAKCIIFIHNTYFIYFYFLFDLIQEHIKLHKNIPHKCENNEQVYQF